MNYISFFLLPIIYLIQILITNAPSFFAIDFYREEWHHPLKHLTSQSIIRLSSSTFNSRSKFNEILDEILIVRVSGSDGSKKVRKFINKTLEELGFTVELDEFEAETPHGLRHFANIIATSNPKACKRLVFACHYDSKFFHDFQFLGATDSAVPCSMLIDIARTFEHHLKTRKARYPYDVTLQLIFFDGEEAFESWNENDSLYGSKHLANKWNLEQFPKSDDHRENCPGDYVSEIDRIEVLVLLDLLGAPNPKFYNFFGETSSLYSRLVKIEHKLNQLNLMENRAPLFSTKYFKNRQIIAAVEDDHAPFQRKGVSVIHIIPLPFPSFWHEKGDNRNSLDMFTIFNLSKIFKVFIAEYLHLEIT